MKDRDESSLLQIRAGRALLGWTQGQLAAAAGVATSTLADYERGKRTPIPATLGALRRALEAEGVRFLPYGAQLGGADPLVRPITPIRWVDAADLATWAERVDSPFKLPTLIARLVLASLGSEVSVRFPSDEGVWASGPDGEVTTQVSGHRYVPQGTSIWELTAKSRHTKHKAQTDYDKRTAALSSEAKDATFVFVTLQRWPDKTAWVSLRKRDGAWRDVRAYDLDDLVHWLDETPSVGAWLAEALGKRPPGVLDLESLWSEWSLATQWPLTTDLVLRDREEDREAVKQWLRGTPSVFGLQGTSTAEVLAFFHAVLSTLDTDDRQLHQARSLVAGTVEAARALIQATSPLVVALTVPDPGLAQALAAQKHHVLVVRDDQQTIGSQVRSLAIQTREGIAAALTKAGVAEAHAARLARDCARNLTVLRRLMTASPTGVPTWAEPTPPHALFAALLAGAWDESREDDRRALVVLAAQPYEAVVAALAPFVGHHDQPLRRIGSTWRIASPYDAWMLLARYLTGVDLDRFGQVITDVFTSRDPGLDLAPADRWAAAIHGAEPRHSPELRHGLGQVLILLALWGDQCVAAPGAQRRADRIVGAILRDANSERWWSLRGELRLLAEAAPAAFLSALEADLAQPDPAVRALLVTDDRGPFGAEYFSNLQWALQTLAWSPQWLPRVTAILADLDALDVASERHANRPASALLAIYRIWHPQTHASLKDRLTILSELRRRQPAAAWKLLLALVPRGQDMATSSPSARWRDFAPTAPSTEEVTLATLRSGVETITPWLLDDAGLDVDRWLELLKRVDYLAPSPEAVLAALTAVAAQLSDPAERRTLWDAVREQLNRRRRLPRRNESAKTDELLSALYDLLTPGDLVERYAWLFARHPKLPTPSGDGWQADGRAVDEARRDAARTLLDQGGASAILAVATRVDTAGYLGRSLFDLGLDELTLDDLLDRSLQSDDVHVRNLAHGLIVSAFARDGAPWAERLLDRARERYLSETALLTILLALPNRRWTWDQAAQLGTSIETTYWQRTPLLWISDDPDDLTFALRKLIDVGRARSAVELADRDDKTHLPSDLLLEVLEEAYSQPIEPGEEPIDDYHLARLLGHLDSRAEVTKSRLAALEWLYLPLLEGSEHPPKTLRRELSSDPNLFAQFLRVLYRPSADSGVVEPEPEDREQASLRAQQTFHLFEGWDVLPGTRDDGTVDGAALEAWIEEARALAIAAGRLAVADLHIGKVLAASPKGEDGHWPAEAVRDAIDRKWSKDLESGFRTGVYNRRNKEFRDVSDGGTEDRAEAARYRAWADAVRRPHPRTGAVLEAIADGYEADAARHDDRAAERDWEY
jgi:transcriptional regulator with XRE-family HTH domain